MKKRLNITLDETTLYHLDGMAYERGVDRSTMITLLVRLSVLQKNYPYSDESFYKELALDPEQACIPE